MITLYLASDIVNPENGEFLYLKGEQLSENVILDLLNYDITLYEVSAIPMDMEIPTLPLQSKDGWESLNDDDDDDEDLGLELNTLNSMFYYISEPDLTEFLIN